MTTGRRQTNSPRLGAGWRCRLLLAVILASAASAAGCDLLNDLFDTTPDEPRLGIAIVQPAAATTAAPGVATIIQWADIAETAGTSVRIRVQRQNDTDEFIDDPIHLVGDGTAGSGRDALADGDNDIVEWDITGVRVGTYVVFATIETPGGQSIEVLSRDPDRGTTGVINVTTALPVPELDFTSPAAADLSVTTGNTVDITWTDNGDDNADALLRLALDPDEDHENGNEITLVSNQPLSESGSNGLFTFFFEDENGATVPDGEYIVFAVIDDNANDIVTVEAEGRLLVNP